MIRIEELARSARDNNALAEHGLDLVFQELGIDKESAIYIAEQRALRAYLVHRGHHQIVRENKMQPIHVPPEDRALFATLMMTFLDGLVTGVRVVQDTIDSEEG